MVLLGLVREISEIMNPWDRPPTRTITDLTDDDRKVITQRANGWESASPGFLALVFSVPVQAINAVLKGE